MIQQTPKWAQFAEVVSEREIVCCWKGAKNIMLTLRYDPSTNYFGTVMAIVYAIMIGRCGVPYLKQNYGIMKAKTSYSSY